MARVRMVTRTVEFTTISALCMDVVTADVIIKDFVASGTRENNDLYLKDLRKVHETEDFKIVAIKEVKTSEVLMGMPETEFIKLAMVLPPRNGVEE